MNHRHIVVCAAGLAILVACERDPEPMPPATAAAEGEELPVQGSRISVQQHEDHGQYLSDAQGRTLYVFTADEQGERSACFDACAEAWPPLFTEADPESAHAAVDTDKLGTIERQRDVEQVTYDGWPLYYYARDTQPMDVEGQGIESFGGHWWLIGPDGRRVESEEDEGVIDRIMPD
jgi:predicted lipoprotein with Yx(FWY)xxD motif